MPRMFAASRGASSFCTDRLPRLYRIALSETYTQYVFIRLVLGLPSLLVSSAAVCRSLGCGQCVPVFSFRRRGKRRLRVRDRGRTVHSQAETPSAVLRQGCSRVCGRRARRIPKQTRHAPSCESPVLPRRGIARPAL